MASRSAASTTSSPSTPSWSCSATSRTRRCRCSRLLSKVQGASKLGLVILDACRNNPFLTMVRAGRRLASIGRGLARSSPRATCSSPTRPSTARPPPTVRAHSPFTEALLSHIEEPGLEINFLFRKVRDDVRERTAKQQEPFLYGSLRAASPCTSRPPQPRDSGEAAACPSRRQAHLRGLAASRMAVTPMPPAVQTEIRPRPRPRLAQELGERCDEARARRCERMADGDAAALDVQLARSIGPSARSRPRRSRQNFRTPTPSASRASARRTPRESRSSRSPAA